jgi:NAD(P)-dependent dehydrogenase (short-subunit alcohol dehydrogenase family)
MRLKDRVAIVTGGARGNGLAIAKGFASEGAHVLLADIDLETAEERAHEISEMGVRALAVRTDVSDRSSVEQMAELAYAEFGRVDILVSNAGIIGRLPFLETTDEEWDRVMNVNLKGVFICGQVVAKKMVEAGTGGSIIHISSIMTERTTATTVPYCASKGGVRTLTKGMAVALAPHGIRVNALSPCIIWTDMNHDWMKLESTQEMFKAKIPLNEIARPPVLVGAAIYLASDESYYVTGSSISIDGGMSAM